MKILNRKENRNGMSLVEALFAVSIGLIIAMVIISVTIRGIQDIRRGQQYELLHSNAHFVTSTFSRLIRQSIAFEVDDAGETLHITLPNTETTTINLSNGIITTKTDGNDSVPLTTSDVEVAEVSDDNPAFTEFERSVRLEITIKTADGELSETFSTTVATRSTL